jgi:hypothetical protein
MPGATSPATWGDAKIESETRRFDTPVVHGERATGDKANGVRERRGDPDAGKSFDVVRLLQKLRGQQDGAAPGAFQREGEGAKDTCPIVGGITSKSVSERSSAQLSSVTQILWLILRSPNVQRPRH